MKICMAQVNTFVGDLAGNCERVIAVCKEASAREPDGVVVFPELTLTGYPPEDLLLRPGLPAQVDRLLQQLAMLRLANFAASFAVGVAAGKATPANPGKERPH